MSKLLPLIVLLALSGCQGPEGSAQVEMPLTKVEWSKMDETSKFETATLERLRNSTPEFQDDKKWQQFLIEELHYQTKQ